MRPARRHEWSPMDRTVVIVLLAIVFGCLFLLTYSLTLGDPVPRRIDAAVVGDPAAQPRTVDALEGVAGGKLDFRRYASVPAARHAIDEQRVYTALDLTSPRPTLYTASAAGASVARVLERIYPVDPAVRVVDTHPLKARDPNGLDVFYRMLVGTIIGFVTVFQVLAQSGRLALRHHVAFVLGLAVAASFALTLVGGVLLHGSAASEAEQWGILALHILAVASFTLLMALMLGRWAIVPTCCSSSSSATRHPAARSPRRCSRPRSRSSPSGCPRAQRSRRFATPSTSAPTSTCARSPSRQPGRRRSSPRG